MVDTPYKSLVAWSFLLAFVVFLTSACAPSGKLDGAGSQVAAMDTTSAQSIESDRETDNWLNHGRTQGEQRFSPLANINKDNVSDLSLAWYVDLPGKRGQEATPLIVDGVMYTTSAWSHVIALDAATGDQLWSFDPEVPKSTGAKGCCDAVNRGVAFKDNRIFLGTLDGRLIALDAKTGEQLWSTVTVNQEKNYTITGAPRVVRDKVFIGNGGAEYGVRGYLSAYNVNDGKLVWRFYTVPGGPGDPTGTEPVEAQTATWNGEWWKFGGGGTAWDSMAYDQDTNMLYFGVGNGTPWNPILRTAGEGDNWFLSSIVAVDADTGEYRWHYQTTPQEAWDFTATQHIVLTDLEIEGQQRKVLMQAPKNGFFYVLDRITGQLISAEPFVNVTWAYGIDSETGRPMVNPEAQYWKTDKPALVSPSWMGGHNWHPMSYSQDTGLVYIPAQDSSFPYLAENEQTPSRLAVNLGVDTKAANFPDDIEVIEQIKKATKGQLLAWDPVQQKEVWRVQYPGVWNGGVLSTAGDLVFQGSAAGFLNAYSASDGEKLWEFPAQTGIVAPPVAFRVNGEQFISVSAGWGGIFPLMTGPLVEDATDGDPINRSRLLTFKIGGSAALPMPSEKMRDLQDVSAIKVTATTAKQGFEVYDRFCGNCHGAGAIGGGVIPDLRYSPYLTAKETWKNIVLDGVLSDRGMIGFGEEITEAEAEAMRQFVITRNQFAHSIGDTQRLSR